MITEAVHSAGQTVKQPPQHRLQAEAGPSVEMSHDSVALSVYGGVRSDYAKEVQAQRLDDRKITRSTALQVLTDEPVPQSLASFRIGAKLRRTKSLLRKIESEEALEGLVKSKSFASLARLANRIIDSADKYEGLASSGFSGRSAGKPIRAKVLRLLRRPDNVMHQVREISDRYGKLAATFGSEST